jgi:hypothetical protein
MRFALVPSLLLLSCASFTAVERGEWQHVWVDPATRKDETVITREQADEEAVKVGRRSWEPSPGWVPPLLTQTEAIGVTVGQVLEFRIDESVSVDLSLQGTAAGVYWNPMKKLDGWKDGNDVTTRESRLLVQGKAPGTTTLKFTSGDTTRELVITVTNR